MDTLLISVTVMSLGMAIAMALFLMRVVRDERRRSDARAALLSAAASEDDDGAPRARRPQPEAVPARVRREPIVRDEPVTRPTRRTDRYVDVDLDLRPDATASIAGVGALFSEPDRSSPWGRRLLVVAGLGAIVFTTGYVLVHGDRTAEILKAPAEPATAQAQAPAAVSAPLELLSMRHVQEPDRLTVTGLVLNPRGAEPLTKIVATVFVFGPDGALLGRGRAPLDFTTIAPGDESPFVVSVPVSGAVARYRVGFRAEDGTVIAHVDKRADALASRAPL